MKRFLHKSLKQTAVYWASPTPDGFGGITYDDPVEIPCRWEERRSMAQKDNGEVLLIKSKVYVVDDLDLLGMLLLGTIDDVEESSNSFLTPREAGANVIAIKEEIPGINAENILKVIYLGI